MSRTSQHAGILLGLVLLAAGCSDMNQPAAPSDPSDKSPAAARQGASPHPNDLARAVPGFGGFFLDATGTPTVYLRDPGQKAKVARALGPYFQAARVQSSRLRVQRGQFDWAQLERWQAGPGNSALTLPGAVFTDADEATNRLRVGVEHGAAGAAVRSALARAGVPAAAVIIEETAPVVQVATLQNDNTRRGGLQINFPGFLCTLGFNDGTGSFITNSHCTNTQGGVESTPYGQPLLSAGTVAIEVTDPGYTTGGTCPASRRCRRSDAARARYQSGIQGAHRLIARTVAPNRKRAALEITGSFTITGELLSGGVVGDVVNKIGRTTGWTQGQITNIGVNTNVSGSNITQLSQTFVSAGVGGGDSGSPVFSLSGTNATLRGILWGGSSNGRSFVFSPLGNIEGELGPIAAN
jgi:hypothetical protein